MPRPAFKRQRSNSKSPKGRVAKKGLPSPAARIQQLDRKLAHKAIGERPVDSDDSDRLVTRINSRTRGNSTSREVYASGAVAKGDKPGSYPTRAQRRQHLERDTKQIIKENRERQSASASKSASPMPSKSPLQNVHTTEDQDQASRQPVANGKRRSATKSPQDTSAKSQQIPLAETSILGTLKPRRRQASILHMIETNDDSTINPEDEEQFLPDDVSTPLRANKAATPKSTSNLPSSTSRKRKLGSDQPTRSPTENPPTHIASSPLVPDSRPQTREPSLPTTTEAVQPRNKRARHSNRKDDDENDIMAPPQSSSPEPSPQEPKESAESRSGKSKKSAPSTKDLQSLMPSKPRQGTRKRTQKTEFDIPEDTASDPVEEEDSVFLPRQKTTKGRKKETTAKPKPASASGRGASTRAKLNPKVTSTTPATPRPSTIRIPLPLTHSVNGENRKLRTPLLQTTQTKPNPKLKLNDTITSSSKKVTTGKKGKQPGGLSPEQQPIKSNTRSTRRTRQTEAIEDQENRNQIAMASSPGRIEDDDGILQTIEHDEDDDAEIEVGRGESREEYSSTIEVGGGAARLDNSKGKNKIKTPTQWKSKWADIDNWDLEYEEVSISTPSDSPGRR